MSNEVEYSENNYSEEYTSELSRISELEECIEETVVGQKEVVSAVATSLYNATFLGLQCVDLIIGPSGSGKTLMMQQFCKEMGLVYTIENATQYTEEGYVGNSVDQMLTNLFAKSDNDMQAAENGILIIDEIGKKASSEGTSNDVSGRGVQSSLLPILSGATVNIGVGGGIQKRTIPFDTSNLKICLMDAFVGLDEIRDKRLKREKNETMGFAMPNNVSDQDTMSPEKSPYTKEDLIEYGMIPELVGRINKIHVMNPITRGTKVNIVKCSKKSRFREYEDGLRKMGITLYYDDPGIFEEIADATPDYQTGARELSNTVNYMFERLCHEIYDSQEAISKIELFQGIAKDNTRYTLQ